MSDIRTALTRKLGPLPAWAWGALGGIALFIYRRRAGSSSQQQTPSYYGPYGQDAFPIVGGQTDSGGAGNSTDGGASAQTPLPPQITVNPPTGGDGTASGGGNTGGSPASGNKTRSRSRKPKVQHTPKTWSAKQPKGGGDTHLASGAPTRPRQPATWHQGAHSRSNTARESTDHKKSRNVSTRNLSRTVQGKPAKARKH